SHSSAAKALDEAGHSGSVTQSGTVINVVAAEHRSSKFLHDIILLVGALG
ncbi:unnamed protein product, partial [marine sediment metagenome]